MDLKELRSFMVFALTHYEVYDAWNNGGSDRGILFSGWHNNEEENKYSPLHLPEEQRPPSSQKRVTLDEVYEVYKKVMENLKHAK